MITVMASDPDVFVREGIKEMLGGFDNLCVVGEACSAAETFRMLAIKRPQVCIVEIAVDQYYGVGLVREIRRNSGGTEILVMSYRRERSFALRAIRAGASGYLDKNCTAQELAKAVSMAGEHRPYLSSTMCDLIAESILDNGNQLAHSQLSDSDFEILILMARSTPPAQIARVCKMSIPAARFHKKNIMKKMNLCNDASVIAYAIEHGLIETS